MEHAEGIEQTLVLVPYTRCQYTVPGTKTKKLPGEAEMPPGELYGYWTQTPSAFT